MRVVDAFAGIGGFSLAADALGWETVAFVERDPDCQFWLGQHWPGVPIYGDICAVRWKDAPPCDVFTAGFPCQPHSVAGKRQASADDRDLWSECVRAIGVLRPCYAVLENVPGLLTSESGRFFNRVLSDLAALGYVGRYDVLSAAECGAPHKRERVWIVAHLPESGLERPVRDRPDGGRERLAERNPTLGDTEQPRSQGRAGHRADSEGRWHGAEGSTRPSRLRLRSPWADAIPYRGADGTVRLIPAGAVDYSDQSGSPRTGGAGAEQRASTVAGLVGVRGQEEVAGAEPALRALAHGIPDEPPRRAAAEEVEAWATPVGQPAGGSAEQFIQRKRNATAKGSPTGPNLTDCNLQSVEFGGPGGSLWPVTDSEPGRVARLRAVGNAVVPAWVLAGPFQYILDRESAR